MQFLGCLLIAGLALILFVIAFVGNIIDSILVFLGLKKRRPRSNGFGGYGQFSSYGDFSNSRDDFEDVDASSRTSGGSSRTSSGKQQTQGQQQHKIFEKDESEYVDFEEV